MTITTLAVAADHPAYRGHFPGMAVLPGVVLLDATLHALSAAGDGPSSRWEVSSAKFQSAVRPGEQLTLQHEKLPNGCVRFSIHTADRPVASGLLAPSSPDPFSGLDRGEQG